MTLSPQDRQSALWRQLEEHFTERLNVMRSKNDSKNLSEIETAYLRGEINQIKAFLALATPGPDLTNSD